MAELTQKTVDERFKEWQELHPQEQAKRIDKIDDIPLTGVKYYYATKSGFIVSFYHKKPTVLAYTDANEKSDGYAQVTLQMNGDKPKQRRVNKIIAEVFEEEKQFFPNRATSNIPLKQYDAHHLENKMIDIEKYADILSDKTEEEKQLYTKYLDNSLDNILGLEHKIHIALLNQKAVEKSLKDEKSAMDYMKKISKLIGEYESEKATIVFNGVEGADCSKVGGLQTIYTLSDEQLKDLTEQINNWLKQYNLVLTPIAE